MPPRHRTHRQVKRRRWPSFGLAVLVGLSLVQMMPASWLAPALALDTPLFGANVYQGLVAVTSGEAGAALMEIGNAGQEIASTGPLRLRPDYLTGANSVWMVGDLSTGRANLHAPGGVCFASGACADTWPATGANNWQLALNQYLKPTAAANTMQFIQPVANLFTPALDLVANNADHALSVSNTIGEAAQFVSGATLEGDLLVDARPSGDEIVIVRNTANGAVSYPVWHAGNDGHTATGTGPDASKLDNINFDFRSPLSPTALRCGALAGPAHCFCADFNGIKCVYLRQLP